MRVESKTHTQPEGKRVRTFALGIALECESESESEKVGRSSGFCKTHTSVATVNFRWLHPLPSIHLIWLALLCCRPHSRFSARNGERASESGINSASREASLRFESAREREWPFGGLRSPLAARKSARLADWQTLPSCVRLVAATRV